MVLDQRMDEALRHQRVAADVPTRFEAEAGMGLPDRLHRPDVFFAVISRADDLPMLLLAAFGARHMRLVAKEAARLRGFAHFVVESRQRRADSLADQRLELPHRRFRPFVEIDEVQPLLQWILRAHELILSGGGRKITILPNLIRRERWKLREAVLFEPEPCGAAEAGRRS